jgi:hypothetical protein
MSTDTPATYANPNMQEIVGSHDVVLITFDTLRFDVAQEEFAAGRLPHLARYLAPGGWEERYTPGSFTYAAHCAFFAGFLPTPACPGNHPRLLSLQFEGSETTDARTYVFDGVDNIVAGFAGVGYRPICIGGVGFFNLQNPLGSVLPGMFTERYWRREFGVTSQHSTHWQVELARQRLTASELSQQRVFLFVNVSAIHQPNRHYLGTDKDSVQSHAAALRYVDEALASLWQTLARRGDSFVIVCSDHGTAYGEDGYVGHRHGHPVVMRVPYAHFLIPRA